MIASTTKYTFKGIHAFFLFALLSFKSIIQAKKANGLLAIKIRFRDLRTLTVWESEADMKNFRNSGFHKQAMVASDKLGINRSYSWQTDWIPNWQEAIAKLP